MSAETIEVGDVVQINETFGKAGWVGAFVLVSEVKSWGVQGGVHVIASPDASGQAYIRLRFGQFDYIGRAVLTPLHQVNDEPGP